MTPEDNAVECDDCGKIIGVYKGEGHIIAKCDKCYQELF